MQVLPIGVQSFEKLRKSNCLYTVECSIIPLSFRGSIVQSICDVICPYRFSFITRRCMGTFRYETSASVYRYSGDFE